MLHRWCWWGREGKEVLNDVEGNDDRCWGRRSDRWVRRTDGGDETAKGESWGNQWWGRRVEQHGGESDSDGSVGEGNVGEVSKEIR